MSKAGENSQAKLSMSSPASGCEILDLTSSPLTEGHGGTGTGSVVVVVVELEVEVVEMEEVGWGGWLKLQGMSYLLKSLRRIPRVDI